MPSWLATVFTSKVFLLALGGAVGTNARYWLARWIDQQDWWRGFPLGTFVVNVSGSFLLGAVAILLLERLPPDHRHWYLLLGTGFCGGYTTFSTFSYETFRLVEDGSWGLALANIVGSVLAAFLALLLAVKLSRGSLPS
jgi:CrcB protein